MSDCCNLATAGMSLVGGYDVVINAHGCYVRSELVLQAQNKLVIDTHILGLCIEASGWLCLCRDDSFAAAFMSASSSQF